MITIARPVIGPRSRLLLEFVAVRDILFHKYIFFFNHDLDKTPFF